VLLNAVWLIFFATIGWLWQKKLARTVDSEIGDMV